MIRRAWLGLAIAALTAASATAAPATRPSDARPASSPAAVAGDAARIAAPDTGTVERRPSRAARTLDDIHIEGEIPVPQVLFITARDQRRLMEFRHRSYWRTTRRLGEDTVFPSWIVVTGASSHDEKEMAR